MPLRPLTEQDLSIVRTWRNSPEVRRNMYTKHEITEAEHKAWFQRMTFDVASRWFVHEDASGQPDGVVYFTQLHPSNASAFWGFYAAPNALPGTGTRMGLNALDTAFTLLKLHKLNAEAIVSNEASLRFQKKLGFKEEGVFRDFYYDGDHYSDVVRLGILASEWYKKREDIQARIVKLDALANSVNVTDQNSGMIQKSYIVASCKPWNQSGYEALTADIDADWHWVSTREQLEEAIKICQPRYVFFLHWNWFVPNDIWQKYECVCFHMTDVPYGRGGSPLQNLIVAGHKQTQLTALRMLAEMDAGPVYTQRPLLLAGRAEAIYKKAGDLSFDIVRWMVENEPTPTPQQGEVVLFKRRTPAQSLVPDSGSLEHMYDHIRMLDAPSYPLAFIERGEFRFEFANATFLGDEITAEIKIRKITSQ